MIIPREYTIIYHVNNDGEDIYDYSRQLCCIIMEHSSMGRKGESMNYYCNRKYIYFSC